MRFFYKQPEISGQLSAIRNADIIYSKKLLSFIIVLGFILRIYVAFFTKLPHMHRDSIDYFAQAETLLKGGYTNFFPNGYPFLIAFSKIIVGNSEQILLLWLNVLLSTTTIYLIYDISRRLFPEISIAFLAAFILAVFPTQINYVRWLTTEVPTAFLLLAAYFCYYRGRNFAGGFLLGLATITRTEELPIIILLFVLGIFVLRKWNWRLMFGALIPILLVGTYCSIKTGKFSLAGHGRVNLMLSVTAAGGYIDWTYNDEHPEITTNSQAMKLYVNHMKSDPVEFLKQKIENLWELWGFFPSSSGGNRSVFSRLAIGMGNVFLVVFGLYGWWQNKRNFYVFVFLLPFLLLTIIHTFLLAIPRYTYPIEPFMILLASWTLNRWGVNWFKLGGSKR
jgi:hypothetical protein